MTTETSNALMNPLNIGSSIWRFLRRYPVFPAVILIVLIIAAIINIDIRAIKPSSPTIERIEEKFETTDPKKAVSGPKIIPTSKDTATNKDKTSVIL